MRRLTQSKPLPKSGFMAIRNPALTKIVRGNLNRDLVANCNLDEKLAHLAGDVSQNLMAILKTNSIHRGRKNLHNGSGHFNRFIVCTCHLMDSNV